jgi:hypothetical protein
MTDEEEEFHRVDKLLDEFCYTRAYSVPPDITEYLWHKHDKLKEYIGAIVIQVPLNVCKCTSEDDHGINRDKT